MKIIIVSAFDWYDARLKYIERYWLNSNNSVHIVTSDFNHIIKAEIVKEDGIHYIHVPPYKKNLSVARLYSHLYFSKSILHLLRHEHPNIVYALVPPNSVAWACGKYKQEYPETKLIFDIIDMWPESYTAPKLLNIPFKFWASLRDENLRYADHIFTECSLYQSFFDENLRKKMSTLYLCRESAEFASPPLWDGSVIKIAYLGSINNIIDIPAIESLIVELSKVIMVQVHIVGGGERKDDFIIALKRSGAVVEDHGIIFNKQKMQAIIGSCHFALNVMKPSVCVGLTIKSMDYFQLGVPMFNTIKGDTTEIIQKYRCGYNVKDVCLCSELIRLLDDSEYLRMRRSVQNAFTELFTKKVFIQNLKHKLDNFFE